MVKMSSKYHFGFHDNDVIVGAIASQITSLASVYSTVCSGADQRKHQSSASLAFVRGIHRRPVNSPHQGPVTRKMVPFDDVIMQCTAKLPHPRFLCTDWLQMSRCQTVQGTVLTDYRYLCWRRSFGYQWLRKTATRYHEILQTFSAAPNG